MLFVSSLTEDGDYFFTLNGTGHNPPIELPPGKLVRIEFANGDTMPHSLHLGDPIHERTKILPPGGSETLVFTVPPDASGSSYYWCDPHLQQGMIGPLVFGDAEAEALEPEEDARTPAIGGWWTAGALSLSGLLAGRRRRR